MLRRFLMLLSAGIFLVPCFAFAASADLRVDAKDIRFSKSPLIAGDTVRIYAKVQNVGTEDVSGYITFYQGSGVIADPQPISVISGGVPEDAYVDFVVPMSSFNIRAVVSGTKPVESNLDNNVAITGFFTPILDDDHDGVPNGSDNCSSTANTDQIDTDHDAMGDVCDDDMDNDSLTNSVESELGTNPRLVDTDGDGVDDAHDAYPLDSKRTKIEKPVPPPPTPAPKPVVVTEPIVSPVATSKPAVMKEASVDPLIVPIAASAQPSETSAPQLAPSEQAKENAKMVVSPNAVFTYEKRSWNTYEFRLVAPVQDRSVYEWNFGDGDTSSKTTVTHTFSQWGDYHVKLKMTDQHGNTSEESSDVHVAFFTLTNPLVIGLLGLLGISLIVLLVSAARLKTQPVEAIADEVEDETGEELEVKKIHVIEE